MKIRKNISILIMTVLTIGLLAGCSVGSNSNKKAEDTAINYVTSISCSKWDEVIKNSTGDQLAIYTQLVPILKSTKQTGEIKKVEIIDKAYSSDKGLAFITVHYIRNVTLPDYGSTLDDKQLLLSMKEIDGQWKIFKIDTVTQLKSELNQ